MELIDSCDLVERLYSERFIDDWQRQHIKTQRVDFERNELLLDILMRRSFGDLLDFIDILVTTNQSHVAKILIDDGGIQTFLHICTYQGR